jgi:hypothetical protein
MWVRTVLTGAPRRTRAPRAAASPARHRSPAQDEPAAPSTSKMRVHRAMPSSGQTPIRPPHRHQRQHHLTTTPLRQKRDQRMPLTQPHLNAIPKTDPPRPATPTINTDRTDRLPSRHLTSLVQRRKVCEGHAASLPAKVPDGAVQTQHDCPKDQTTPTHTANWHDPQTITPHKRHSPTPPTDAPPQPANVSAPPNHLPPKNTDHPPDTLARCQCQARCVRSTRRM